MNYEHKDPRLLQEVGDLNLPVPVFINQIGLLYLIVSTYLLWGVFVLNLIYLKKSV